MRKEGRLSGWRERSDRLLGRLFPKRQLMLRTDGHVTYILLSRRMQVGIFCLLSLIGAWTAYGSVSYVLHGQIVAAKDGQIANAKLAYRSLLNEVVEYQNKFSSIALDLEENYDMVLGLVEKNTSLQQNLKTVKTRLKSTEKERSKVIAAGETLKDQLTGIKDRMRSMANHNFSLKGSLDTSETDLQTAMAERNQAQFEGVQMRRQLKKLEARLGDLQDNEMDVIQRLTEQTIGFVDDMEKVIAMTGLKADRLLSGDAWRANGQGGPFIAAEGDGIAPGRRLKSSLAVLDSRIALSDALREALRGLPLTAPLNTFYVTSSYGKRRDPVNKKWAMHYGLDLGGPIRSTVYATAPGVVTYAGWKGKYGKLVEVTHGNGIKTRYGHMRKILVKKGQKVSFRDKVGVLGSTGRSTGPHLHYEVVFKGKSKNPLKFIKAGRYVFKE